jgi:hypothetical protein
MKRAAVGAGIVVLCSVPALFRQNMPARQMPAANVNGERTVWMESIPLLAQGPEDRGK